MNNGLALEYIMATSITATATLLGLFTDGEVWNPGENEVNTTRWLHLLLQV